MKKPWILLLTTFMTLASFNSDAARRLGGGRSIGQQSTNVTPSTNAPAPTKASAAPSNTPGAPAAAAPRKPWGGMLGGLAAGLGLAWLAHSLGLGEMGGAFLMLALLGVGLMLLLTWLRRSRQAAATAFAYPQGSGPVLERTTSDYRPENVGNDASARPWERKTITSDSNGTTGSMIGSALIGNQTWGIPAGFDSVGFLQSAKANFVSLQAAWDQSDIPTLRLMMTDEMLAEIQTQLAERQAQFGTAPSQTDVVMLHAQLLGIEDQGAAGYLASVEFSGMIREEASAGPNPFREVWNMRKAKTGTSGWLVAGVQALQ